MYTLKTPSPSKHNELGRAFSELLAQKSIELVDRRNVTAYILGTIAGGSLPVVAGRPYVLSETFRTQHLALVKEWLGRVAEAIPVDIDLALIAAYNRYAQRCNIAYPIQATLALTTCDLYPESHGEQIGLFEKLCKRYPSLIDIVPFSLRDLLTLENNNV